METHKLSEASIPRGDSKSDYKFCRKSLINLRKEILFQFVKEIQSGALRQRTRGPANCLIGRPRGILIGLSCPTRSLTPQISSPSMCGNMYFVQRVHINGGKHFYHNMIWLIAFSSPKCKVCHYQEGIQMLLGRSVCKIWKKSCN